MRYLIAVAILFSAGLASPQSTPVEHAATAEQCKADELAWSAENTGSVGYNKLSFSEIQARAVEMSNCGLGLGTDRLALATALGYSSTALVYEAAAAARLRSYLLRHNEASQFVVEDTAGAR